jgi:hypothetical protein
MGKRMGRRPLDLALGRSRQLEFRIELKECLGVTAIEQNS